MSAETLVPNDDGENAPERIAADAEFLANQAHHERGIRRLQAFAHRSRILGMTEPSLQYFHDELYGRLVWQEARQAVNPGMLAHMSIQAELNPPNLQ